jgi:hypothetical protein
MRSFLEHLRSSEPHHCNLNVQNGAWDSLLPLRSAATDSPLAQAGTFCLVPYALLVQCLSSPLAHFKPGTPIVNVVPATSAFRQLQFSVVANRPMRSSTLVCDRKFGQMGVSTEIAPLMRNRSCQDKVIRETALGRFEISRIWRGATPRNSNECL